MIYKCIYETSGCNEGEYYFIEEYQDIYTVESLQSYENDSNIVYHINKATFIYCFELVKEYNTLW